MSEKIREIALSEDERQEFGEDYFRKIDEQTDIILEKTKEFRDYIKKEFPDTHHIIIRENCIRILGGGEGIEICFDGRED